MMTLYAVRDRRTGRLIRDLTSTGTKFWTRRGHCERAIESYLNDPVRWGHYDPELLELHCFTQEELDRHIDGELAGRLAKLIKECGSK